jgi:uncharacterized protein involved in type VI secretion and phage assembly
MDLDTSMQVLELLRGRFFGKYRGQVVSNEDSTARGRLQVRVPAVLGELAVWAMPCVPYAGNKVGWFVLPEPQTGVWVEFEGGDPSFPIWVGCFWAEGELPDENTASIKVLRTEKTTLRIDDAGQTWLAATDQGAELELSDEVRGEAGGGKLSIGNNAVSSSGGTSKLDVGPSALSANDGAWEVV